MDNISYTTEEIAAILKVSKLTVYDLIKKGDLAAYRVGRQMRIDAKDLEAYKAKAKGEAYSSVLPTQGSFPASFTKEPQQNTTLHSSVVISGQDISLDILTKHIEKQTNSYRPLRSYHGSLNGLISLYKGEADVISTHLLDGDTGEYNLPYIKRILVNYSYVVLNLVSREAGFYVAKGNPKQIQTWEDLRKANVKMINREKGSGARVLLDEQLRVRNIPLQGLFGYEIEATNHLGVAGAIASGEADVGIGIEKAAYTVGVDFVPLTKERYDLVMIKSPQNQAFIHLLSTILKSPSFQNEVKSIGGYDLSKTGQVIFET